MELKNILKLILISFLLTGIIFINGCKSPETIEFENNLAQIKNNLDISLKNINIDFSNYDYEYKPDIILRSLALTQTNIDGMKNYENQIFEDLSASEFYIKEYNTLRV